MARFNCTGTHFELESTAAANARAALRPGHYSKAAPRTWRAPRDWSGIKAAAAFLAPVLCVAAFLVQL